ncbi:hypothetical protein A2U01_0095334, partial [Trifolium medium]|nr:hypothetical protein [Trifolium medium]
RASKGKGNLGASVICASRKRERRVAPVSWTSALGCFGQWRVAQIHPARSVSSSVLGAHRAEWVARRAGAKII